MVKKKKQQSQMDVLLKYYKNNPNRNIEHPEAVDWVTKEWKKQTGKVFRDPDRGIRKLHQNGYLMKIKKGVYRYEPDFVKKRLLEDFSPKIKEAIFKRDKYRCVLCGRGRTEGVEIQADHKLPKDKGGKATLENGQTLCAQHNFIKKNFGQTTLGKRFFVQLYKSAKKSKNKNLIKFCLEVLGVFDKYNIDIDIK